MGHRDSPAQFGGPDQVCVARGRAYPPARRPRQVGSARSGTGRCRSLAAQLLLDGLHIYQGFLSPLMPWGCKFYPSCSHYASQAIELHGARRGAWLALLRLLRCRPLSPGGFDPPPEPDAPQVHGAEP